MPINQIDNRYASNQLAPSYTYSTKADYQHQNKKISTVAPLPRNDYGFSQRPPPHPNNDQLFGRPPIRAAFENEPAVVVEKSSCCSTVRNRIREFSEETVMQGLGQMLSSDLPWFTRIAWCLIFMTASVGCMYLVTKSFCRYFTFEVSTTTSLETLNEVAFPAITFCNENMLKKSMVEYSPTVIDSLTALSFGGIDEYKSGDKSWRTCARNYNGSRSGPRPHIESFKDADDAYNYFRQIGMNKAMAELSLDSRMSVLKCWLQDKEEDCSNRFLNHITDYGWCFTMNPGKNLLQGFKLGFQVTDTGYGIKRNAYSQVMLQSTGPYNGFKILLHVHQDEYCVTRSHGAGFTVLVHDADVQPLFFLERPVSLSPGYETNVAVRYTKMTKSTAGLGRCIKDLKLKLYPDAIKYYKQACFMECFTMYVYKHCNCTPLYGPPRSNYNLEEGRMLLGCWRQELIRCMKDRERKFLIEGLDKVCAECDDPCDDLHYDFQVSTSYFPGENFRFLYQEKFVDNRSKSANEENKLEDKVTEELDIDYLRSNLVSANFFVESMQVHVITERQAFTLDELVGDVGAHIGNDYIGIRFKVRVKYDRSEKLMAIRNNRQVHLD